jgi:hypothetical protein
MPQARALQLRVQGSCSGETIHFKVSGFWGVLHLEILVLVLEPNAQASKMDLLPGHVSQTLLRYPQHALQHWLVPVGNANSETCAGLHARSSSQTPNLYRR